jgi:hypothetical protein
MRPELVQRPRIRDRFLWLLCGSCRFNQARNGFRIGHHHNVGRAFDHNGLLAVRPLSHKRLCLCLCLCRNIFVFVSVSVSETVDCIFWPFSE